MSGRALGMVVACMFFAGSTGVYAEDANTAPVAPAVPQTANVQVASVNLASFPAKLTTNTDPLHADARWPLFKNCIDNTANSSAFQACLQMAFLGEKPSDKVLALLTR